MSQRMQLAGFIRMGWPVLIMAAIAGCTISIQPWTKPQPAPSQFPDGAPNPNAMTKSGAPQRSPAANNEATSRMIKDLNEEHDLRDALQQQVVALKKQLKERDDSLQRASYDIEDTTKQLREARKEFRQWQAEVEELRERLHKLEENRSSAKQLSEDIYRYLDHDKEKSPKYPPPKQ